MFKKTALGIAAASAITVAALSGTTTAAQAGGGFYVGFGAPGIYFGHGWGHTYANPCRRWLRRYDRTGRRYYLRRYNRCIRRHW